MSFRKLHLLVALFVLLAFGGVTAQDTTSCEAGFRLITHTMGETCVSENPQRVVALEWTYVEDVLALGIQPVAIADIEGYNDWVKIPVVLDDSVQDVGDRSEPNLELITELNPDLIIAVNFRVTENYDDLSAIAPTLVFDPYPTDLSISQYEEMTTTFTTIATALNREAEGQQVLAQMEDTYANAQAALEAAGRAGEAFILSQGWTYDNVATFRLFTDNAMAVQILDQIGLENAWDDAPQQYGYTEIGIEGFAELRADDFNFFYVAQDTDNDFFAESPLWSSLAFVESERAYWMGGDVWLFGGPLSAEVLVDTVLRAMEIELPDTQAAQDAAFPITIEHKFGSTAISQAPERVVVVGFSEQDSLLALGVVPVAVRYWYGDETDAIFPWAEEEADGARPVVLNMPFGNLNYEAILALDPDLIVAVYAGITQEEFDTLSQIAPTIAQSGDYIDFGMPWQETTRLIGSAVGKLAEADVLVNQVEASFEDARTQNPEFEGKSVAVVYSYGATSYGFYTAQDPRGRFFTDLGFVIPDQLVEIAGDSYYADISAERIDLLDQDLLVFVGMQFVEGGRATVESDPLISQLDAVREGRVLYVPDAYDDALQFSTVLSLEYALEGIVPELQAIFGESASAQAECEPGFRLFDHEYLAGDPVCIPENPQRILALEISALETVLFTDKELVGTAGWLHDEVPVLMPELAPALEGVADTGYPANLEVALLAEPDLILAVDGDIDLEAGSEIASIVMPVAGLEYNWKLSMEFWSEVLGTQDLYADMIANYEARLAEFQEALTDDPEISIIGTSSYGTYMWLEDTAPGVVVADAGLSRPESQALSGDAAVERYGEQRWIQISEERYDLADADAIFVFSYATTDPEVLETENTAIEAFRTNAVWNSLSAVETDHVYYVGPHWWRAQTYLLANMVLDDLFTHLTDSRANTPVLSLTD
jgi:iron complex transport system substrate-binding protein